MQDFYDCRAGDFVWSVFKLAFGSGVLDREVFWNLVRENRKFVYGISVYGQGDGLKGSPACFLFSP